MQDHIHINNKNISLLDEKILNPLIQSMGLSDQDQIALRKELTRIITAEALLKLSLLPKQKIEELKENFNSESPFQNKLNFLQEIIKNYPEVQKAITKYFEEELPVFIKKMLTAFLEKATEEQKNKFFRLSQSSD